MDYFPVYRDIKKYPSTSIVYNGLAVALMQRRDFREAERVLEKALEQDPHNADAHLNYNTCREMLSKPVNAELTDRYVSGPRIIFLNTSLSTVPITKVFWQHRFPLTGFLS